MLPYIDNLPFLTGWQYRWFVLDENAGLFSYYTSKEKMVKGVRRGCVRLQGAVIGIDDEVSLSVQCGQRRPQLVILSSRQRRHSEGEGSVQLTSCTN
jgi:hypothetical protein